MYSLRVEVCSSIEGTRLRHEAPRTQNPESLNPMLISAAQALAISVRYQSPQQRQPITAETVCNHGSNSLYIFFLRGYYSKTISGAITYSFNLVTTPWYSPFVIRPVGPGLLELLVAMTAVSSRPPWALPASPVWCLVGSLQWSPYNPQ